MNTFVKITLLSLSLLTTFTHAEPSSDHASKASKHSALASGHGLISTAQVASGVAAIPLIAVGSVGAVASIAAGELIDSASKPSKVTPTAKLEITEVTITVDRSPAQAMKSN